MRLDLSQLLQIRKQVVADYRDQKNRFTNDIDYLIGKELRILKEEGSSTQELQEALGTKDYRTLKHYLDHQGDLPLPRRMEELPRLEKAPTKHKSRKGVGDLMEYLTFYPREGKVVAVDVPAGAWTEKARIERPDLFPISDGYNGWAYFNEGGRITRKSEIKSPLLGENKHGVLTPALLKEKLNAQD